MRAEAAAGSGHEPELRGQTMVVIGGSATYDVDGGQQLVTR